jgi:hypothetical protein
MSHNVFKLSRDYKEVKSALVGNFHIFMAETVTMGFPNQVDKDSESVSEGSQSRGQSCSALDMLIIGSYLSI